VPHRLELVRELRGVRFVNDSKATNTAAARRGVAAYPDAPIRLILGGSLKGEDFAPFAAGLPTNVRSIFLIGEAARDLAAALAAAGRRGEPAGDLDRAVAAAAGAAEPGDVVLLSPACASFDQFDDFEHRGDTFRRLVHALR
jgi:UDP-N-acetylmuramoylalanine--D-glutamate ligase